MQSKPFTSEMVSGQVLGAISQTCGGVGRLEYLKATKSDESWSNPQHHGAALLFGVASIEHITRDPAVRCYDRASPGSGDTLHSPLVSYNMHPA